MKEVFLHSPHGSPDGTAGAARQDLSKSLLLPPEAYVYDGTNTAKPRYDYGGFVKMDRETERLGTAMDEAYKQMRRSPKWRLEKGKILVQEDSPIILPDEVYEVFPNLKTEGPTQKKWVDLVPKLKKEKISAKLARRLRADRDVEWKGPFYGYEGAREFIHDRGRGNGWYPQWTYEEWAHGELLDLILNNVTIVGDIDEEEVDSDLTTHYYTMHQKIWVPPFNTGRKMTAFATIQEENAVNVYDKEADEAELEGAFTVAQALRLVQSDESFHRSGFKRFGIVHAQHDLPGTVTDYVEVAHNYRMPAQGPRFQRDFRENLENARELGTYNDDITRESIYRAYATLPFIGPENARRIAESAVPRKAA